MFKKIAVVLTAAVCWSGAAQELLRNGDFSQGLKSWVIREKNGVTIEEKAAPGGKNAMKVVSVKGHYGANYSLSGKLLKPNTDYTVRGKIKTEGNAQVYLYFCRTPGADKHHSQTQVLRRTSDWTEVYCLLNSGTGAKGLPVLTRMIGPGTAWFADISIREGNHLPMDNMFLNSDFKLRTRYKEVPDNWTCSVQTGVAAAENYSCRVVPTAPPVANAGVLEVKNALVHGNLRLRTVPGQKYTFSFYAKNQTPGAPVELHVRCSTISKRVKLTDDWKRYVFTDTFKAAWVGISVRATRYDSAFLFSAPQLVPGTAAVPWIKPKQTATVVTAIKEAVAEADCRRIAGEPRESDWKSADAYPIEHITKGVPAGLSRSKVRLLHNGQFIFIRFEGESDPAIKTGDKTRLNWYSICDTFELFITDTALDGTYIQYAVNVNGHDYTGRNVTPEVLGITSTATRTSAGWRADVNVPLKLFRANKNWKIAFGRCYDHARYGRMALDWSLPGSRGNTAKFGILKGVSVIPVASLELEKLYGTIDGKSLCYEFSGVKKEMLGGKLTASIVQNGKTLWSSSQNFTQNSGKIALPGNYRAMMNSTTRIALNVTGSNGKNYYQASRVLYLMFSSYAKLNRAMMVYPKYNLFTEKDKTIELQVELDKKQYDRLRITLLDGKGKAVYRAETTGVLAVPSSKIGFGRYKIQVEALKGGIVADIRCHETFEKLPFRPELVRLNRLVNCLADTKGNFIPMLYYPCGSSNFSLDPDIYRNRRALNQSAKKAGFNGVKRGFSRNAEKTAVAIQKDAADDAMPILVDMESCFPPKYYSMAENKMSGPETEKVMIETMGKIQKLFFGRPGILSYAPYHEPGYYRGGRGIVDSYRVAEILPELRKADPYRPITGFWAPPHWDANGEPFGSVDGVDYFIVDVYTRNLKKHCDELWRIANASRAVHRPLGQIFNVDNLGSDERECPTPAEYRAEVYAALIAGYRVFYVYIGLPPVLETWEEMKKVNHELPVIAKFICSDQCRELASVNEENVCYAVYRKGKELLVMASSKSNDSQVRVRIDLKKLSGLNVSAGKALFGPEKIQAKDGRFEYMLPAAGSGIWVFTGK